MLWRSIQGFLSVSYFTGGIDAVGRYLDTEHDLRVLVKGVEVLLRVAEAEPLASRVVDRSGDDDPGLDHRLFKATRAEIEEFVRKRMNTSYHPTIEHRFSCLESLVFHLSSTTFAFLRLSVKVLGRRIAGIPTERSILSLIPTRYVLKGGVIAAAGPRVPLFRRLHIRGLDIGGRPVFPRPNDSCPGHSLTYTCVKLPVPQIFGKLDGC